jgi:uroporphyrinogen-III synthase
VRPDAVIRDLRGNIDTRLRKGRSEEYDAVILASAGLQRMGWQGAITSLLPVEISCPAPGQGALAIETRLSPDPTWDMVATLDNPDVRTEVAVERAFLRGVGGGCTTPIGAHARIERMHGIATVRFWGMLASDDGARLQRIYEEYPLDGAEDRAFDAAAHLLHAVAPKWTGIGDHNPLAGLRVVVTGSDAQATPLIEDLREHGALPHRMRTIDIAPVEDERDLRDAVDAAVAADVEWLVLTSPNAVPALAAALAGRTLSARVAVVGSRTAETLRDAGIEPALVSAGPGAVQLVADLDAAGVAGSRVLCLLSDKARPALLDGLRAAGADVRVATAYINRPVGDLDPDTRELVRHGRVDVITFASPSAIESFRNLVGADLPAMSGAAFFAIGPTTADALHEAGLPVHGEARTQDAAGFIEALRQYFGHTLELEGTART